MARKKKHPEHANHERWLVSYADFITLLFAFFVVMFAVSQVDSKKVGRFSESFKEALDWDALDKGGRGLMEGDQTPPKMAPNSSHASKPGEADYTATKEKIRAALANKAKGSGALSGMKLLDIHGELVIRIPESPMFDVGNAELHPMGRVALDIIADELKNHAVRIRVEGHTDSSPIHTSRYPSNWELSTARATAVVAFFIENNKLAPQRLAAAGYGEFHPVATNETAEGRAQNRRVDIIVVADFSPRAETKP